MGPIIEPLLGKLADALTSLGGGESWLLAPRQLGSDTRLWSPGIRAGDVTLSGRVEALPFLQEQAISVTNHRFGNHDAEFEAVLPRSGASPQVRDHRP